MKLIRTFSFIFLSLTFFSCVSTKNTLKNIDNLVPPPKLSNQNTFIITEFSADSKYGFDKDYPINVYYQSAFEDDINIKRYLNALSGPNGELISYKKTGICCPFPTKNTSTGGGFLDVYEITYSGLKAPIILYLNRYEKGKLQIPIGLALKK